MKYAIASLVFILVTLCAWYLFAPASRTDTSAVNTLTTPGGITISHSEAYGLATTPEQVLVRSYIPPCDADFDYCFYRTGETYAGTNFESAGLRVRQRTDLKTESTCLSTLPAGYSEPAPKIERADTYATSAFSPLGDAGAGHYASGALYRLFFGTTCYEFETRIGESQYANYPEGSIGKFTDAHRAQVEAELRALLDSVTIANTRANIAFPQI